MRKINRELAVETININLEGIERIIDSINSLVDKFQAKYYGERPVGVAMPSKVYFSLCMADAHDLDIYCEGQRVKPTRICGLDIHPTCGNELTLIPNWPEAKIIALEEWSSK